MTFMEHRLNLSHESKFLIYSLAHDSSSSNIRFVLFHKKIFCEDSFSHFPLFDSIKKLVNGKLSLVNGKS